MPAPARRSVFADRLLDFPDLVFSDGREFQHRGRWREHFVARMSGTHCSLSPVLRGEGGGEGRAALQVNDPSIRRSIAELRSERDDDSTRTPPLSPALSPEYREAGGSPRPARSPFDGRIVFEIGCNDAGLLASVAAKNPMTAFVGIDWKCRALHAAAARVAALDLHNVALLHGRAQDIGRFFADGEVDEVWIFHPEPLDNPRELKNRLVTDPFLLDVHRALSGGGAVVLKTDHRGYFDAVLELLGRMNDRFDLATTSFDFWNDAAAQSAVAARAFAGEVTAFESRFVRKRKPIYFVEARARPRDFPASM